MPRKCKQASSSGAKSASKVQAGQTVGACVRELRSFKKPNKYGLKLSGTGGGTRTPTRFQTAKNSAFSGFLTWADIAGYGQTLLLSLLLFEMLRKSGQDSKHRLRPILTGPMG